MATAKPAALITGGAKGIGRAIARRLVSSGWQVGIIDLADSGLHRAFARERDAFVIEGDVRDEDTASDAVEATIQRFHRPDAVVSNAGIVVRILNTISNRISSILSMLYQYDVAERMSHVASNFP